MENNTNITTVNQEKSVIENEFEYLRITPATEAYLLSTTKWALFLAIIGFIGMGFMIIGGISMMGLSSFVSDYNDFQMLPIPQLYIVFGIAYIILAIIYFFPLYYLVLFATKTKQALNLHDQKQLDEGFKNMKRFAKFVGIMTIVMIVLSAVIMGVAFSIALSKGLGAARM